MTHAFGPDIRLVFDGAGLEYDFGEPGRECGPGCVTTLRIGVALQTGPPRLPKPLGLVGAAEVRQMLRVGRARAYQLTASDGFPVPAASLDCGNIWLKSEVKDWIEVNRPSTPGQFDA